MKASRWLATYWIVVVGAVGVFAGEGVVAGNDAAIRLSWRFDEGAGSEALDSSGHGLDGMVQGAVWTRDTAPWDGGAYALRFDGKNDLVEVEDDGTLSGLSNMSVSCWFKAGAFRHTPGEPSYLVSKDYQGDGNNGSDSYDLNVYGFADGRVQVAAQLWSGSGWGGGTAVLAARTVTLSTGRWYHAAFSYDGAHLRLYLDGSELCSAAYTRVLNANTSVPLRVGECSGPRDRLFCGVIDEVCVRSDAVDFSADADHDGLVDVWEGKYFGNRLLYTGTDDPDLDRWSNAEEMAAGSSPVDPCWFPVPRPLDEPGCAVLGGRVYLAGGTCSTGVTAAVLEFDPNSNAYTERMSLPAARSGLRLVCVGEDLYAVGGDTGTGAATNVFRYSVGTDGWTEVAGLSSPRSHFGAAVENGRIYVFGGADGGTVTAGAEVYNPASNEWSELASLPYQACGIDAVAGASGRIYLFGAGPWQDGNAPASAEDVLIYDPEEDTYTNGTPLESSRPFLGAVRVGNDSILVAGGADPLTDRVEVYSPGEDNAGLAPWDVALPYSLRQARRGHGIACIGTNVYVFGGGDGGDRFASAEKIAVKFFSIKARSGCKGAILPSGRLSAVKGSTRTFLLEPDPGCEVAALVVDGNNVPAVSSYTFTDIDANHSLYAGFSARATPDMPAERTYGDAVKVESRIYYVGGYTQDDTRPATMMVYDVDAATWSTTMSSLPTPRLSLGVATVDGRLYAAGGHVSSTDLDTFEVWEPDTGSWSSGPDMPNACASLSGAVVAQGGKVYVACGNRYAADRDTIQIFDVQAGTWSVSKGMGRGRRDVAVAVVRGVIYVIGGAEHAPGGPATVYTDVHAYYPGTDTWEEKAALPEPREHAEAVVVRGNIFLFGGRSEHDTLTAARTVLRYSPFRNDWTVAGVLPASYARTDMQVVRVGGRIFLLGGKLPGDIVVNTVNVVDVFDLLQGDLDGDGVRDTWSVPEAGAAGVPADAGSRQTSAAAASGAVSPRGRQGVCIDAVECGRPGRSAVLSWQSVRGRGYTVYRAPALGARWEPVHHVKGSGLLMSYTNGEDDARTAFFRLGVHARE